MAAGYIFLVVLLLGVLYLLLIRQRTGMQKWQYIDARCLHIGDITIRKN